MGKAYGGSNFGLDNRLTGEGRDAGTCMVAMLSQVEALPREFTFVYRALYSTRLLRQAEHLEIIEATVLAR